MADRRLAEAFRPLAEALLPDRVLSQERSVSGAINDDATVRPESLTAALPWQVRDAVLPGEIVTGANVRRFAMPQGARIRHVALSAGTPPAGDSFVIHITAGSRTESISLPAGQATMATGLNIPVDPGVFVGISVMRTSGAEDVTISIHYTVGA